MECFADSSEFVYESCFECLLSCEDAAVGEVVDVCGVETATSACVDNLLSECVVELVDHCLEDGEVFVSHGFERVGEVFV